MKQKVNKDWYNQQIKGFRYQIKDEIRLIKLQYNRYFNYPTVFDSDRNISKEKIYQYLFEAQNKLGTAEPKLKKFVAKFEPCDNVKPDFKAIEAYIKKNASKIDKCKDIKHKFDFYVVSSNFFCSVKWQVPHNKRNYNRVYDLMYKYCKGY